MQELEEKYKQLYETQDKIISLLVKENLDFYLTGGTALQRFYFNDFRYSDDLDFFLCKNGIKNKNSSEFDKFIRIIVVNGRDAHTPYTQTQSLDGRLAQKNISSTTSDIILQNKENDSANIEISHKFRKKHR